MTLMPFYPIFTEQLLHTRIGTHLLAASIDDPIMAVERQLVAQKVQ